MDGTSLVVSITNVSGAQFSYYFAPTSAGAVPAFVWVKVKDQDNKIVSASPTNPDGFWTVRLLESSITQMPLASKRLDVGETVETRIAIKELLMGLDAKGRGASDGLRYCFKTRVYLDEKAAQFMEFESDWMQLHLTD